MKKHPSHVTKYSKSSLYGEDCINCKDEADLEKPCPNPPEKGGMTFDQWLAVERGRK